MKLKLIKIIVAAGLEKCAAFRVQRMLVMFGSAQTKPSRYIFFLN